MQIIRSVFVACCWCVLILAGFLVYGVSGHDDPHGNLWFAHTILEYGELVNYNGNYVQQNTSFLQVWLTVLLGIISPLDLIACGYMIDIIAGFFCCWLITKLARRLCPDVALWPAWVMLSSASFMLWLFGGMGGVLTAFCMLLAVAVWWLYVEFPQQKIRRRIELFLTTVALVIVRPEMPIVIVAVALFLFLLHFRDKDRQSRFLDILLINIFMSALMFIWQKYYFSSWLPLPIFAKLSSVEARLQLGLYYVTLYSVVNIVLALAVLLVPVIFWFFYRSQYNSKVSGGLLWKGDRSFLTLLLLLASFFSCYFCFVISVGGDWMQAGRFMVPIIPLASLLVVALLSFWMRGVIILRVVFIFLMVWGLCSTPSFIHQQTHGVPIWAQFRLDPVHEHYTIFEKYNQEHLRDMAVIDHLGEIISRLNQQLDRPVHMLSGQSGMVNYRLAQRFYKKMKFSDLRGIYENGYASCPLVNNVGRTAMGLSWSYVEFLEMWPSLEANCHLDKPDIIYDLDSIIESFEPHFIRAGYTMIHREQGHVIVNRTSIVTHTVYVPNVIFVRNDLLPLLGNPQLRVIHYPDVPLRYRAEQFWR